MLRKLVKYIAGYSPFSLTQNEYYDRLTEQIIKKVCNKNSVCVDVGANEGKILNMFIKQCPQSIHYAFEPLPDLYFKLVRKYGSAAKIFKTALSDKQGIATFHYVSEDAAYSSLKMQIGENRAVTKLEIEADRLDNMIPEHIKVDLIKLDIEGGEYEALTGAQRLIERCKPIILFEFGKGGSNAFNITPQMMFDLIESFNYEVNKLTGFLTSAPALSYQEFEAEYEKGEEYMFIAYNPLA